jgi:hypothetical protein
MESPVKHSQDKALKELLEEGARSYLEAATALVLFQREVQNKCRDALEEILPDYSSALIGTSTKSRFRSDEVESVAEPAFSKWEGDWWSVGVQIVRRDLPKLRWWTMQCCLERYTEGDGLYCWIAEWFPTSKVAGVVFDKFRRLNRNVLCEGKAIWLESAVPIEEVSHFEDKLDRLLPQWVELWEKVGGIREALRE